MDCALAAVQKRISLTAVTQTILTAIRTRVTLVDTLRVRRMARSGVWVKMIPVQTKLIVAMIFIVMNATKIL